MDKNRPSFPMRKRGLKPQDGEDLNDWVTSLPMRERGLKLEAASASDADGLSLPMRERGLKLVSLAGLIKLFWSLPMRERGLKPHIEAHVRVVDGSLPMRERGLKLNHLRFGICEGIVAPHAGAWIEIFVRPDSGLTAQVVFRNVGGLFLSPQSLR